MIDYFTPGTFVFSLKITKLKACIRELQYTIILLKQGQRKSQVINVG